MSDPAACPYRLGGAGRYTRRKKCPCGAHDLIESVRNCEYNPEAPDVINSTAHVDLHDHSVRVDALYATAIKSRKTILESVAKTAAVHAYGGVPTLAQVLGDVKETVDERDKLEKLVDAYALTLKAVSAKLGGTCDALPSKTQLCREVEALIVHRDHSQTLKRKVDELQPVADRAHALKAENEQLRAQLTHRPGGADRRLARVMRRVVAGVKHCKSALAQTHPDKSACKRCAETCKFVTQIGEQLRDARRVGEA